MFQCFICTPDTLSDSAGPQHQHNVFSVVLLVDGAEGFIRGIFRSLISHY